MVELKISDVRTGQDITLDIIGNAGGFEYSGDFKQIETTDGEVYYLAEKYAYNWWKQYFWAMEWGNEIAFQLHKELSDDPELIDWFDSELYPEYQIWFENQAEGFPPKREAVTEWFNNELKSIGWTLKVFDDNSILFSKSDE